MTATKKRDLAPQTPGTEPNPDHMPPQEVDNSPDLSGVEVDEKSGTVTVSLDQLQVLIANETQKAVNNLEKQRKDRARLRQAGLDPNTNLPDQSEVNSREINRAVLTKQGYVVPDERHKYAGPKEMQPALRKQ